MTREANPSTAAWIGIAAGSTMLLGGLAWWLLRDDDKKPAPAKFSASLPMLYAPRQNNPINLTPGI